MFGCFLRYIEEYDKEDEDNRIRPHKEAACRVGVHRTFRLASIHAVTQPYCSPEIGWTILPKRIRTVISLGTDRQPLGEQVSFLWCGWSSQQAGTRLQANNGFVGRSRCYRSHTEGPVKCHESQRTMAECHRKRGVQKHVPVFFISLGARFGRIRKTPNGKASPQFYAYKVEKLQGLVNQYNEGSINLYFGDESHVCTEGYVPYGWQFPWEDICIPSQREKRLNIFGMIDYGSNYHGFSTTDSVTSELVADFLDRFSMTIKKDTFIVLDNAKVHRSKLMKEMRAIWEKRGLYIFFLPPYSPHLNIAETVWRIMKGKGIQPSDYNSADSLFYAANRYLAALGSSSKIAFTKFVA